MAAEFGISLLPWQLHGLALIGELFTVEECEELGVPFGTPAYREVWWVVPRQSGKTTGLLVAGVDRCLFYRGIEDSKSQRVVYTAQSGVAARDKMAEDWAEEFLEPAPAGLVRDELLKITKGMANTSIRFKHGRILAGANSESSGHGKTVDLGMIDEAWHDVDDRRQGALTPGMITRKTAQLLGSSTVGTIASAYLNRKIRVGRRAAEADKGSGIAYLEYSAEPDCDPYDEETWRAMHPALGLTQSIVALRVEADSMETDEFKRAYLNIATNMHPDMRVPWAAWQECCGAHDPQAAEGDLVWSFDVSEDREHSSISVARRSESVRVGELVDYGRGTGWVIERLNALTSARGGVVGYDSSGPGQNLAGKLTAPSFGVGPQDMLAACSTLTDLVVDGDCKIRQSDPLDVSLRGSGTKRSADRWAWVRHSGTVDASPIIALTIALAADTGDAVGSSSWVL